MDKPTVPNFTDLGLLTPGTDEHKRVLESIRAIQQAEQGDPELRLKTERRNADMNAVYRRQLLGKNQGQVARQEELLRDTQHYLVRRLPLAVRDARIPYPASDAEVRAACDTIRDQLVAEAWKEFIPRHKSYADFGLDFRELEAALWTEGLPSLQDRANAAVQTAARISHADDTGSGAAHAEAEPTTGARKRGRPQKISDERKAAAQVLKDSGGTNRDAAAKLYGTAYPTPQQVKNASSILREHKKKSKPSGKSIHGAAKPRKIRG